MVLLNRSLTSFLQLKLITINNYNFYKAKYVWKYMRLDISDYLSNLESTQ